MDSTAPYASASEAIEDLVTLHHQFSRILSRIPTAGSPDTEALRVLHAGTTHSRNLLDNFLIDKFATLSQQMESESAKRSLSILEPIHRDRCVEVRQQLQYLSAIKRVLQQQLAESPRSPATPISATARLETSGDVTPMRTPTFSPIRGPQQQQGLVDTPLKSPENIRADLHQIDSQMAQLLAQYRKWNHPSSPFSTRSIASPPSPSPSPAAAVPIRRPLAEAFGPVKVSPLPPAAPAATGKAPTPLRPLSEALEPKKTGNNAVVNSGDERRKEKDRDKERRERRDRDKDRGKDKDREKDRDRKRSRRSRSRERGDRRDKDKERERRDYPREDGGSEIRVKEEPPDDYEYPPQEYDEEYNNYDPETVKYEQEEPSHFQTEEY